MWLRWSSVFYASIVTKKNKISVDGRLVSGSLYP